MAEEIDWHDDAWRDQTRENSARHAFLYKTYASLGSGELIFEEPVDFGLWFTEEPMVSYGFSLDPTIDQDLVEGDFPMCSGGVIRWQQNVRGLYVGATVFAVITNALNQFTTTNYYLVHNFTFSGIGAKNVGSTDFEEDDG